MYKNNLEQKKKKTTTPTPHPTTKKQQQKNKKQQQQKKKKKLNCNLWLRNYAKLVFSRIIFQSHLLNLNILRW